MKSFRPVDFFHVGPQKTATTWVFNCLKEHPRISTSKIDSIHYYSMQYYLGQSWYMKQFSNINNIKILFDPTPNYFRSPVAPERIAKDNPKAKILICIRNPIERAFSHYWHEKKKLRFNFKFEEALDNFDLFTNWIEPGFYSIHIKRFLLYFSKNQILFQFFDNLKNDPRKFLQEILNFIGLDDHFEPSVLYQKINAAIPQRGKNFLLSKHYVVNFTKFIGLYNPLKKYEKSLFGNLLENYGNKRMETLKDVNPVFIEQLNEVFKSEINILEDIFNIDLSHWRDRTYGASG